MKKGLILWVVLVLCGILALGGVSSGLFAQSSDNNSTWVVEQKGNILEIAYGSGSSFPQFAALHLDSGYFRMNYGPGSGWGTSVILLPSFWTGETYFQGAAITIVSESVKNDDQVIAFSGTISGLKVIGNVRIKPPSKNSIKAIVSITKVVGSVALDKRPGEAFKPVMLSSMHFSSTQWEASKAFVGTKNFPIPQEGWIIQPPVSGQSFGLKGGTSSFMKNAPSVEILFNKSMPATGWVSTSSSINDKNVGFWCASNQILRSWQYTITVSKP